MKKVLIALIVVASIFVISCNPNPTYVTTTTVPQNNGYGYNNQYDMVNGPNGQQMVVVRDNGRSYLMEYLLFSSLMNRGGYGSVINHYHSYPSSVRVYNSSYNNWRRSSYNYSGSANRSYTPSTGSGFRNVKPTSGFRSSSSGSVFSTPTRSSSSGFRSSSSGFRSSGSSSSRSSSSGFRSSSSSSRRR